jgi:hypothetical protein
MWNEATYTRCSDRERYRAAICLMGSPRARRQARSPWTFLISLLMALVAHFVVLRTRGVSATRSPQGLYSPDPGITNQTNLTVIRVGIYILNVHEVIPTSNSFWCTFYFWLKWPANATIWLESDGTFTPPPASSSMTECKRSILRYSACLRSPWWVSLG